MDNKDSVNILRIILKLPVKKTKMHQWCRRENFVNFWGDFLNFWGQYCFLSGFLYFSGEKTLGDFWFLRGKKQEDFFI